MSKLLKCFIPVLCLVTVVRTVIAVPVAPLAAGDDLFRQGRYPAAAEMWESGLTTTAATPQRLALLLRLAEVYQITGHHEQATPLAERALAMAEDDDSRLRGVSRLIDIHLARQHSTEAWELMTRQLLPLAEKTADPALRALALNSEGNVLRFFDEYIGALLAYREAAGLAKGQGDALSAVQALANAADTALLAQQPLQGRAFLYQAWTHLQQQPAGHERLRESLALTQLALQLAPALAEEILVQTRAQLDLTADMRLHAYVYGYLGRLYEQAARYPEALHFTERARFLAQDDDGLGYLWLWQRGRLLQAQGKTAAAADAYRKALALLQPIRSALLTGRRNAQRVFREDIRPVYYALADVLLRQAAEFPFSEGGPTASGNFRNRAALLAETRDTLEALRAAELQDYFQDECVTALRRQTVRTATPPPHTAVVYPVLLPDRTELLVSLVDGLRQVTVAVPAAQVTAAAVRLQKSLQIRTRWDFVTDAKALYAVLVAPLRPLLAAGTTLVFVPDGALRMIPPAALISEAGRYVVEDFAVATTPGLELTDMQTLPKAQFAALLNGLSQGVQGFSPLPSVRGEIERIRALYPSGVTLVDEGFLLKSVGQALSGTPYHIVHVASHGQFERDPEKSFVLTYDSKLTMNRLEQLLNRTGFHREPVELLTLSACQTAVGDERAALGLAGVAVKAGARSALASLWFVDDEATAELVVGFYYQLRHPALSKAQALQSAQQNLLGNVRFRHPAYWAPFLLIGNWL